MTDATAERGRPPRESGGAMVPRATPADPAHASDAASERSLLGLFAVAFVFLTLVAVLAVPLLVGRQVEVLRQTIEAAEPARREVNRLQFSLARQMVALSELLITQDDGAAVAFREAREDEEEVFEALAPYAAELGPEVVERFGEVRVLADRWHSRAADEDVFEERTEALDATPVPRGRQVFEELLDATASLDSLIQHQTVQPRDLITRAERTGLIVTGVLALLAVAAAGVVVALAIRAQRLAEISRTRRQLAEAALEETARAHRARERLLRGITHDVKNPLGVAKGYAELLEMGVKAPMLPQQAPLVEGLQRAIESALAIIADLLDVARADSGGLSMQPTRVELHSVLAIAVEDHRASAETAGHTLEIEPADEPLTIETDPLRVRQIVDNLLSNAVKYTPRPGRIMVRAERVDGNGDSGGGWVAVHVSDTGPGIPPRMRERIFDEFVRLDEKAQADGHGLGLTIARRIARLLAGDLTVDDADGGGADFVLWLPCDPPA
ncbi:MAG TPA: HAMP domain-containing sensor histidine kinase [Longimicrobiaceae bacterium]